MTDENGWHSAPEPKDTSDALSNVSWALDQMIDALNEGRYNFAETHVRADLTYLRSEVRRAKRQRIPPGLLSDE